jgi:hypothetical protein
MSNKKWKHRIPGGTTRHPSEFDFGALVAGAMVEREHTSDPCLAMEIAMDHLDEDPHYYCKLARIENPNVDACVLTSHQWDKDTARCGADRPSPTQAARNLANKRWRLSPDERRLRAKVLRGGE